LADETIIMAPATAQPLSFESEGNAGNTHENLREIFEIESCRRLRRLENSIRSARKLGTILDSSDDDHAGRGVDARIEDGASRRQRVA